MDTTTADLSRHRSVLNEADAVYIERGKERGQLWKSMTLADAVLHIKSKTERIKYSAEHGTFAEDDAVDLINYAVFYIRLARAELNNLTTEET